VDIDSHTQEQRMSTHIRPVHQQGVTLVESMIVLLVLSIVIGVAVPGLQSLRQRAALFGTAAQLETDLQFARSHARAVNRTVRFSLSDAGSATCYMVHTGPAADCRCGGDRPAACSGDSELLRAVSLDAKGEVQVRSASKSVAFDPLKGTVTPTATLRVEARDGRAIHQVVNLLGRVRSCSPLGRSAGELAC
jgi:type IV fimbrial biogenesis protein FimT